MFTGNGALYEGDQCLGDASYMVEIIPPELPGGVTRISGQIAETDIDLFGLFVRSNPPKLTLHLEGGIRWDCGLASSDGRLRPVGSSLYRVVDGGRVDAF